MISDHQHITDESRLGIIDFICPKLSFCRSPGIPVVEQEANTDGDHACVCVRGGRGGLGICGLGVKRYLTGIQFSLLSSEVLARDTMSSPAEQPRTGEGNVLQRTRDSILFILYQISTSHSLGSTGGDTVNCYSFHFLFFPLTEHKHIITQLYSTIFRVDF